MPKFIKEEYVSEFFPKFVGKYKYTDTLHLSDRWTKDTTLKNDFIWDYSGLDTDKLTFNGFEIIPDYSTTIYWHMYGPCNAYYPVYIVNETSEIKEFFGKDGHVFGLEEALDSSKYWRPIEGRGFDFCGNGHWRIKVHPQEFMVVLFPKYLGTFKTKLRVRISNLNSVFVSNSFEGVISEKQLSLRKGDYLYRMLMENKENVVEGCFYGAIPLGINDKDFGKNVPVVHNGIDR